MWERYCRGVSAIVCVSSGNALLFGADIRRFIVDAADRDALPNAREELHILLSKQSLEGIPLLVLGNKSDLPGKLSVDELVDGLALKSITHRELSCYGISAKEETNLEAVLQWLMRSTK